MTGAGVGRRCCRSLAVRASVSGVAGACAGRRAGGAAPVAGAGVGGRTCLDLAVCAAVAKLAKAPAVSENSMTGADVGRRCGFTICTAVSGTAVAPALSEYSMTGAGLVLPEGNCAEQQQEAGKAQTSTHCVSHGGLQHADLQDSSLGWCYRVSRLSSSTRRARPSFAVDCGLKCYDT